jgi:ribosomal protein L11 methyltransferase
MEYIELSLDCNESQKDMLIAEMAEIGFEGFVEHEDGFSAFIPIKDMRQEALQPILDFYEISKNQIHTKNIAPMNWNNEWEKSFEPIVCSNILIKAPFHKSGVNYPKATYDHELIIMPQMSFGTGNHETTRLMIQMMEMTDFKDKNIFDYGSGTGVLAILAMKMGAKTAFANDTDEWAADNIAENIALNNLDHITFQRGDIGIAKGTYHIILANITRNVLLETMTEMKRRLVRGGTLILSGFFPSDVDELCNAATAAGFNLNHELHEGQWASLSFTA